MAMFALKKTYCVVAADEYKVILNTVILVPSSNSPFCVPQNTKHTVEAKFKSRKKLAERTIKLIFGQRRWTFICVVLSLFSEVNVSFHVGRNFCANHALLPFLAQCHIGSSIYMRWHRNKMHRVHIWHQIQALLTTFSQMPKCLILRKNNANTGHVCLI